MTPIASPHRLTLAVEDVEGLVRYQIVQTDVDRFLVRAQGRAGPKGEHQIVAALRHEVGDLAAVEIRWEADLEPPSGRKFRVVECRLPAEAACAS